VRHENGQTVAQCRSYNTLQIPELFELAQRVDMRLVAGSIGGRLTLSMHHYHAVIWIDHREARVFHFSATETDRLVLQPSNPTHHIHHKANTIGSGHLPVDQQYLHDVALTIADAGAVLVTGPANAKTELVKHIRHHDPRLMNLIVGVETVDHLSDAQLMDLARKYFKAADRMLPQTG
jgi:hypothetical protein